MHAPKSDGDPAKIVESIRQAMPGEGLFAGKDWLITPQPFPLSRKQALELEKLGHRLFLLQKAFNRIYHRSVQGKLPAWIAACLDAGKPERLLAHARSAALRDELPRVIRPDLILTDREPGLALTELDSVPGGIGLTAWLNQTYAAFSSAPILGGADGMLEGFRNILPGGADIVVSQESADYRPEMEWLAAQLNLPGQQSGGTRRSSDPPRWQVHSAEDYRPDTSETTRGIYRFFELFDLDNIPFARDRIESSPSLADDAAARVVTPPLKPALEEKLWMALFWIRPLHEVWRRELRGSQFERLKRIIPYSWVMDPAPLPYHAVIPLLDVNQMREIAGLSQKDRDLVLKISGFSDQAWGSRGVHIGGDMPQEEWRAAVLKALDDWQEHPCVLQEFHKGKRVQHPYWDPEVEGIRILDARVRLCPYYFNRANPDGSLGDTVSLGGVLATIVPSDKKVLHGMRDAIMAPCCVVEE